MTHLAKIIANMSTEISLTEFFKNSAATADEITDFIKKSENFTLIEIAENEKLFRLTDEEAIEEAIKEVIAFEEAVINKIIFKTFREAFSFSVLNECVTNNNTSRYYNSLLLRALKIPNNNKTLSYITQAFSTSNKMISVRFFIDAIDTQSYTSASEFENYFNELEKTFFTACKKLIELHNEDTDRLTADVFAQIIN